MERAGGLLSVIVAIEIIVIAVRACQNQDKGVKGAVEYFWYGEQQKK